MARFGSAAQAFDASSEDRTRALAEADRLCARARACGARVLTWNDNDYPEALRELHDPPLALFAIGALELLQPPTVAIVGTRRASPYGERITREIAGALARGGATVLSGLARGIDGAAHRGALAVNGKTAAVLGTGVDIAYPAAHRALHERIGATGLLLSEEPPGEKAHGGSFPKRNRIIAALARVVIVVEAPHRSGALITANHALDLGRAVAAVPGRIDDPVCAGSNRLLRDGAVVIADIPDALTLAGLSRPTPDPTPLTDPAQQAVWDALAMGACDVDALSTRSRLPARECMTAVTALEIAGRVECELTGEIRRR